MKDQATHLYKFGPFVIDIHEHRLLRDGKPQLLTPKVFSTLALLVQNSGHIVTKDELMKAIWPDSFVEEANLTQNIFSLRKILGENANGQQYIETIPKRGYRFIAAVEEPQEDVAADDADLRNPRYLQLVLAISLVVVLGLAGLYLLKATGKATSSLAVLPFVNETADPDTDYLSDGITESIINSLSQLPNIRIMARNTVFSYKGQQIDPRKAGRELNVDAVLMGRVIQRGETLDIQTELVDVAEGSQLWGKRYNRKFTDIFEVQDEIAKQISEQL